jgi:hypothetical protein
MTTPPSAWPIEYHIMVEYVERLSRQLGQLDAASAATERRLLQLEQELRERGAVPAPGTLDEQLVADPNKSDAPLDHDPASASPNTLLIAQFLTHIELLSRVLGRHDGVAAGIEQRLNELSAFTELIEAEPRNELGLETPPPQMEDLPAPDKVILDNQQPFASDDLTSRSVTPRFAVITSVVTAEPAMVEPTPTPVQRMPWIAQLDVATIALPILLLLALIIAITQVGGSGSNAQPTPSPNPANAHATASVPPAEILGTAHSHATPLVTTPTIRPAPPTNGVSPTASATSMRARPTIASTASPGSTITGLEGVTATVTRDATAPSPDATATRVDVTTATAVSPTETNVAPTLASLVAGGVGSTRAEVEQTFGVQESTNATGEAIYQEGSVFVLYSADDRALRVTFDISDGDLTDFDRSAAISLATYYRPSDALLIVADPAAGGVERSHYTSASLTAAFANLDTAGRDAGSYVEELRFDTTTDRPLAIVMALGQEP